MLYKMNKFNPEKYDRIIKELVNKSFSILKNKKIIIKRAFFSIYSAETKRVFSRLYISINPKYDIYNNFELKGVLAHELSHLEDFVSFSFFEMIIHSVKYVFSLKYRRNIRESNR